MTRIEWLLKGDPLYSLQVARRTAIDVTRGSYTTRERSGPEFIQPVIKSTPEPSLFEQLFRTTTFDGGFKGKGYRAVLP